LKNIQTCRVGMGCKEMKNYAKGIRKFQRELKISVSDFPQPGFIGELTNDEERDSNNKWTCGNSGDVQKEIEDYELQKAAEDPFRTDREPDLRKLQTKKNNNTSDESVRVS
jgi:hypothetical protein